MEMEVRLHMQLRAARVAPIHGLSYGSGQALRFPSEAEIGDQVLFVHLFRATLRQP